MFHIVDVYKLEKEHYINSVILDIESIKKKDFIKCNKNTKLWKDIYERPKDVESQLPIKKIDL